LFLVSPLDGYHAPILVKNKLRRALIVHVRSDFLGRT